MPDSISRPPAHSPQTQARNLAQVASDAVNPQLTSSFHQGGFVTHEERDLLRDLAKRGGPDVVNAALAQLQSTPDRMEGSLNDQAAALLRSVASALDMKLTSTERRR